MSQEQIVDNLGTIARSGTKAFLESLKEANTQERPELIGQFGVGFYASFMVADRDGYPDFPLVARRQEPML